MCLYFRRHWYVFWLFHFSFVLLNRGEKKHKKWDKTKKATNTKEGKRVRFIWDHPVCCRQVRTVDDRMQSTRRSLCQQRWCSHCISLLWNQFAILLTSVFNLENQYKVNFLKIYVLITIKVWVHWKNLRGLHAACLQVLVRSKWGNGGEGPAHTVLIYLRSRGKMLSVRNQRRRYSVNKIHQPRRMDVRFQNNKLRESMKGFLK